MSEESINEKKEFYESKIVIVISIFSSIFSLPLSFLLAGKVTLAAILALIIGILIITANLYNMINFAALALKNFTEVLHNNNNFTCTHNCKEVIQLTLDNIQTEFIKDLESISINVEKINEKVDKTPESFDLLNITDDMFMIISNEYTSKSYNICIEGKHVIDIELESTLYACKSTSHQFAINMDLKNCTDIKRIFELDTKIGLNHSFFKLKNNGDNKSSVLTMSVTCNNERVVNPIPIKFSK